MRIFAMIGRVLKWGLAILVLLSVTGCVAQQIAMRKDIEQYPAPGTMVSIGPNKLHLYCMGEAGASPTVLLDGGATFISTGWQWVTDDLSKTTRVCAFDRSGIGWSEEGVHPYEGPQITKELHTLVRNADIATPFVLVGHSLGGNLGRIYYDHYPNDLAGLIMIEPGDPEIFLNDYAEERGHPAERTEGIRPCGNRCRMVTVAAHLGIVRFALGQVDMLHDPKFPEGAAEAYRARMSRPENIRQPMSMGRYVTRIMFQTADNKSLGDLPVMGIYSTGFGTLLGADMDADAISADLVKNVAAWKKTTATSSRDMGVRAIEGGNHLAVIGYQEHAEQVANLTREMLDEIEQAQE